MIKDALFEKRRAIRIREIIAWNLRALIFIYLFYISTNYLFLRYNIWEEWRDFYYKRYIILDLIAKIYYKI